MMSKSWFKDSNFPIKFIMCFPLIIQNLNERTKFISFFFFLQSKYYVDVLYLISFLNIL